MTAGVSTDEASSPDSKIRLERTCWREEGGEKGKKGSNYECTETSVPKSMSCGRDAWKPTPSTTAIHLVAYGGCQMVILMPLTDLKDGMLND